MNANDVIECYVTDVAVQLPRRQRNDVAFELRALIDEGLQDKAEAAGRAVDAAMATEFLNAFGRPTEVAARYRPTLAIIDPADGHAFLRASVIGLAIIWLLGLLARLGQPMDSAGGLLGVLGQWWGGTVIPSLWWPGVLVVGFAGAAWTRRRWPQTSDWKPRAADRIQGGRAALAMGIVGIACGVYALVRPRWLLDYFWGGHAAPSAYAALTYADPFLRSEAPWLLALLLLNIPVLAGVIVQGRWSPRMRRLQAGLGLITCAVLAWTISDGPVFITPVSDRTVKSFLVLIVAFTLIHHGIRLLRSVRPAPDRRAQNFSGPL
jgi:hypothetical protein